LALEQAGIIGRKFGSRVTLYHSQAMDEHWEPDEKRHVIRHHGLSDEGRAALDAACEELTESGIDARLVIDDDKAWIGIIRHVLAEPTDLVVVSKRSHLPHDRPCMLGSVTNKLLRKCPCAVWAVKDHPALQLNNVLVATDLGACEGKVLSAGVSLMREWKATVHVLYAFQVTLETQMCGDVDEYANARHAEVMNELRGRIRELGGDPDAMEFHVGLSSPTYAIEEAVRRCDIDLVVMGSVGRAGVAGVLLGNTAERVLGHVDRSLLVVKPDDFICPVGLEE
jgi:universal stress protein E